MQRVDKNVVNMANKINILRICQNNRTFAADSDEDRG